VVDSLSAGAASDSPYNSAAEELEPHSRSDSYLGRHSAAAAAVEVVDLAEMNCIAEVRLVDQSGIPGTSWTQRTWSVMIIKGEEGNRYDECECANEKQMQRRVA
jgi:hypothetical protein